MNRMKYIYTKKLNEFSINEKFNHHIVNAVNNQFL